MRRPLGVISFALVPCLLTLAACGSSGGSAAPEKKPQIGSSAPPSASPNASNDPFAIPTAVPAQQLTFDFPTLEGRKQAAVRAAVKFEIGLLTTLRSANLSPLVRKFGDHSMVRFARKNVHYLRSHNTHFDGPIHITITDVQARKQLAVVDTCGDSTRAKQVVNGKPKPLNPPLRAAVRLNLDFGAGGWKVTSYDNQGGKSC